MRRLLDVVRGLLAAATIAGLLVGVPVALVVFVGWPIDDLVSAVTDDLLSDNARVADALLSALTIITWLAWAQIAFALVVEVAAVARGRVARRAFVAPGLQPLAARLVAASMLLFGSLSSGAASVRPLPALAIPAADGEGLLEIESMAWATAGEDDQYRPISFERADEQADQAGATYEVASGDTYWSLAERFLGDGLRWRELRQLNVGRSQADGAVIAEASEDLGVGWVLELPPDAVLPFNVDVDVDADAELDAVGLSEPDGDGAVVVEPGDSFWSIADEVLTETWGRRPEAGEMAPYWADLVDENEPRLLPPHDADLIYPEQRFVVPPAPPAPPDASTPNEQERATPEPDPDPAGTGSGDSGTDESPRPEPQDGTTPDTGSGDSGTDEFPRPEPQDGTTPGSGDTDSSPPSPGGEDRASTGGEGETTNGPTAPPPVSTPTTVSGPPGTAGAERQSPAPGLSPGAAAIANEPVRPPARDDAPDESGAATADGADVPFPIVVAAVSGIGLLAASLWRALSRRRSRAIATRRPGLAPRFSPAPDAEQLLVTTADERALTDLDRTLRALGAEVGAHAMPDVVGVVIDSGTIALLLDVANDAPPPPFTPDEGGRVWRLDRSIDLGHLAAAEAPFPALVTVGHTAASQLLVNLEHARVVRVTGTTALDVTDTMATMALELATSPVADNLEVLCVGFGQELASLERVAAVDTLDAAIGWIEEHASATASLASEMGHDGPAGRVAGVGGDGWTPLVVFDPRSGREQALALIEAASRSVNSGVTAVVTAAAETHWSMHVTSGQIEIPFLGVTRRRRNLRRQERTALVATLADAADPGWQETVDLVQVISTAGSGQPVEQPEPLPEWDVDVVIRLLGPLSVETAGGEDISFVRGTTAEFVAYLAHHRRGVSIDATMEALWPNAEPKRPWINNLSSDARKALGPDRDGELLLPRMTGDGLYRLSPRVGTDLERFEQLVEHATAGGPAATGALRLALDLVTGPPYASVGSGWPQLEGSATRAVLAVDEAARALAVMALEAGDVGLADWATGQGLLANPASSELHLLRLRAAAARGHGELAVEAVYQQYRAVTLGDDDQPEGAAELDPRIVELYTSYRRSRPANWVAGGDGARAGANERTEPADDERGHAGRAGAGQGNGDAHPGGDGGPERRDGGRRGRQPPLPPPDRSRTGGHGPGPRPAG